MANTRTGKRLQCPACNSKARKVSPITIRALLNDDVGPFSGTGNETCPAADGSGCTPQTQDTGWRFCDSRSCDVVYFSENDATTFTKSQLKVAVGVKDTDGERPLCYCFGHSVASIKEELRLGGSSVALEDIRQKMKDPGCHCETANPSGSCCLSAVAAGIKVASEELGVVDGQQAENSRPSRGETIAKVGTVLSAVMASSCCWLPLVLIAVGVSGAGVASTLEAYRPLFIVVTFGFLGAAFYFTYRPKKQVAQDCCSPVDDDCCKTGSGKRRVSMMALNKVMLWGVTVMAVVFLLFPSYVGVILGTGDRTTVTENMSRAVFRVDGMTCEGCSSIAAKAIRTVPGVLAVTVDYETSEAVVGTEICCPIPEADILTALEEAGYTGTLIEAGEVAIPDKQARDGSPEQANQTPNAASRPILFDLDDDAGKLRQAFNAATGKARVVMLVSPG